MCSRLMCWRLGILYLVLIESVNIFGRLSYRERDIQYDEKELRISRVFMDMKYIMHNCNIVRARARSHNIIIIYIYTYISSRRSPYLMSSDQLPLASVVQPIMSRIALRHISLNKAVTNKVMSFNVDGSLKFDSRGFILTPLSKCCSKERQHQ